MVRLREVPAEYTTSEDPVRLKQQIKQLKARIAAYEKDKHGHGRPTSSHSPTNTGTGSSQSSVQRKKRRKGRGMFGSWSFAALAVGVAVGTVTAVVSSGGEGILLDVLDNSIKFIRAWLSLLSVVAVVSR